MGESIYFGWDMGGTNIRGGRVNPKTGEIIGQVFKRSLLDVTSDIELTGIVENHTPKRAKVGISSAGVINEKDLVIEDCPNSAIKGKITFPRNLQARGYRVTLANDMKSAQRGEAMFGQGKGYRRVLVATLSSGFNCNAGDNSPEFGHMPGFNDHYCGCGAKNHLEFDVSGNGAASRAQQYLLMTKETQHPILKASLQDLVDSGKIRFPEEMKGLDDPLLILQAIAGISSKHVYQAYGLKPYEEPQKSIRDGQVEAIAKCLGMMNSAYNPLDIIVLMGSQTNDRDILIQPAIDRYMNGGYQLRSLPYPKIVRTTMPEPGVQGAVADYIKTMETH